MATNGGDREAWTLRLYGELRGIAQRLIAAERIGHTLQPTALVHEAWLRMAGAPPGADLPLAERKAIAARVLRQVLVDHHRSHAALKRGGGQLRVELTDDHAPRATDEHDFEALDLALERLRALHARQAEVVELRAFGDMTMQEIADALDVAKRTVEADWVVARAWLTRELGRLDAGLGA